MKKLAIFLLLVVPVLSFGQNEKLPASVVSSFKKNFPDAVINSWTGNDSYNYLTDWSSDVYYGDFNFDGFPDDYNDGYYGNGDYYEGYGDEPFYYDDGLDYDYYVPEDYVVVHTLPTQYQLNFTYKGGRMSGIFKADGAFVIAKARSTVLPIVVVEAVKNAYKGNVIRIAHEKEILITPENLPSNPVYRLKVFVKHAGYSIMKIDSKGKVISNNKYQ
ncbi:hypothetical protein ACE1ET_12985 [Saccharicrinis sp. FJH62]|uniref:hypothetical protein n=1 Tax=Saccharicrinis sp. FJH62 TaxID=3344657 RepID=UPI0035D487CD